MRIVRLTQEKETNKSIPKGGRANEREGRKKRKVKRDVKRKVKSPEEIPRVKKKGMALRKKNSESRILLYNADGIQVNDTSVIAEKKSLRKSKQNRRDYEDTFQNMHKRLQLRKVIALIIDTVIITYVLAYPLYRALGSTLLASDSLSLLRVSAWLAIIAFIYAYLFILINKSTVGMYVAGLRVGTRKDSRLGLSAAKYSLLYSSIFIMFIGMLLELASYVMLKDESMFEMLSGIEYKRAQGISYGR